MFIKNISTVSDISKSKERTTEEQRRRLLLFKECLSNSAVQALVKLFTERTSLVVKIFWLICLACACSLCAYFIIETLIQHFTPISNTLLHTHFETMSVFPRVTLCNKNQFTTKYAYEIGKNLSYDDMLYYVNTQLNDTQRGLLQHSLEEILFECKFNQVKCTASDFKSEYNREFGACFTFNTKHNDTTKLRESIRVGSPFGLRLTLYVNFYEKLMTPSMAFNDYYGLIVKIGNNSFANIDYVHELTPGFKYNIVIDRYFERYFFPSFVTESDI